MFSFDVLQGGCIWVYIVIFALIFRGNQYYSMQGICLHSKELNRAIEIIRRVEGVVFVVSKY